MKFWEWLTAGPKAAEKVLDSAIAGVDKIFYTDEERAEARKALFDGWIKVQELLGEETTVRGMTRRILAIMCLGVYIFLSLLSVAVWKWDSAYADFIWEVCNAGHYGYIALTIVVFYFGPYVIERLFGKK